MTVFATAVRLKIKKNSLVTAFATDIAGCMDSCKPVTNIIVYNATEILLQKFSGCCKTV